MGITEGNAQGESRTPTSLSSTDFKCVYLLRYNINYSYI